MMQSVRSAIQRPAPGHCKLHIRREFSHAFSSVSGSFAPCFHKRIRSHELGVSEINSSPKYCNRSAFRRKRAAA